MRVDASEVVVALSGGIDSLLAVLLLREQGRTVHGLHFLLPTSAWESKRRVEAVRAMTRSLGIPLEVLDLREFFEKTIITPFVDSYLQGLTPNPCVACNRVVKFEYLLHYARERGIDNVATGHYARVKRGRAGSDVELWRGRDRAKEQSYFLHRLGRPHLSRSLFPLGEMTKEETLTRAREWDIASFMVPESQEICFVPGKDYRMLVQEKGGVKDLKGGRIINGHGKVLGTHGGFYRYTVGQRQGLGIASSRPYYVKEIRPAANEVVVVRKESLYSRGVTAGAWHWTGAAPKEKTVRARAQIRYRHKAASGRLEVLSADRVRFTFDQPQWAVTPGQALVCYDGDRVLGGGWIKKGFVL